MGVNGIDDHVLDWQGCGIVQSQDVTASPPDAEPPI